MKDKKNIFIKLAKSRVTKAVKAIELIGNLSNKSHYSYTADQVNQMMSALEKELRKIKSRFKSSKIDRDKSGFNFK